MVYQTLCIFGTRPEAIKMLPVIKRLQIVEHLQNKVCITGQHQQMLHAVLDLFDVSPDYDLEVMVENQSLSELTANIITKLDPVLIDAKPDLILVHGDTTTTLAASLAAYYHQIPIAHVEAGLRTGNIFSPWPEEANRRLTGALATLHFAPTAQAKENLLHEGISAESIHVTGNTVIDMLFDTLSYLSFRPELEENLRQKFCTLTSDRKMILVTGHRRESFGAGFQHICQALAEIAHLYPDINIVYPVHLNPNVQQPVKTLLKGITNIHLIDPVDYISFVYLMKMSFIILTDSGGVQEEAPSLNKPVLVMREITERPEALNAGAVRLVGADTASIVSHVQELLTSEQLYQQMARASNPYGDGQAAARIVNIITQRRDEQINRAANQRLEPA